MPIPEGFEVEQQGNEPEAGQAKQTSESQPTRQTQQAQQPPPRTPSPGKVPEGFQVEGEMERGPTVGPSFQRKLKQADISDDKRQRLLNVGITPGTAIEWAAAHLSADKAQGEEPTAQGRQTLVRMYRDLAGDEQESPAELYQQTRERMRKEREGTMLGQAQNVGLSFLSNIGSSTYNLMGVAAPETAEELDTEYQSLLNPETDSWSGKAGNLLAETGKLVSIMKGGQALGRPVTTMAGTYGVQGAGATRREADRLREEGKEIGIGQELVTAAGTGATEALSGVAGARLFGVMGRTFARLSPTARNAISQGNRGVIRKFLKNSASRSGLRYAGSVAGESAEEGATELVVNKIRQSGINPEVSLADGLGEALVMGAILAPVGGAMATTQQRQEIERQLVDLGMDTSQAKTEAKRIQQEIHKGEPQREEDVTRPEDGPIEEARQLENLEPSFEEALQDIEQTAQQEVKKARRQPQSGETIVVDQQGRAMSADQAEALEQAGVDYAQQQRTQAEETTQRALPAPTRRFVAGEEGVTDLQNPQAERRSEAPRGREHVNRLIEAGNIEAAKQRIQELEQEIRTDPLTGEGNKYRLNEVGQQLEERANRRGTGQPIAYLDLDNLHTANETLGHEALDARMTQIAQIMREEAGDKATITRQGGDEFAIAWTKGLSQRKARQVVQRVEERVGREKIKPGVSFGISGGVGVVRPGSSFSNAYNDADTKATEAKRQRKIERGEAADREAAQAEPTQQEGQTVKPGAEPRTLSLADDKNAEAKRRAHLRSIEQKRKEKRGAEYQKEARRQAERQARQYQQETGYGTTQPKMVDKVQPETAQRISMAYENLEHNPQDEKTRKSYEAFKAETLKQFQQLREAGYTFELEGIDEVAERYPSAADVSRDLGARSHLVVAREHGDMPDNHPLREEAPGTDGWTYNQVFRAVHDVMGHAATGNDFSITGEENAWRHHASMYSKTARGALATETRAQSNWTGYGPYGKNNREQIRKGNLDQVQFPPQKAGLLPERYWTPQGVDPMETGSFAPTNEAKFINAVMPGTDVPYIEDQTPLRQAVSKGFTPVGAVVRRWSPRLYGRLKQMFGDYRSDSHDAALMVRKFQRAMKQNLGRKQQREALSLMQREQPEGAKDYIRQNATKDADQVVDLFDTVKRLADNWHAFAQRAGVQIGTRENLIPRRVDPRKYREFERALYGDQRGELERLIDERERKLGRQLDINERAEVANQWLGGFKRDQAGQTKVTGSRSVGDLSHAEWEQYYMTGFGPLYSYFDNLIYATHKAKMFGKKSADETLNDSLGRVIEEGKFGIKNLSAYQQDRLKSAIESVFTGGEMASGATASTLRDLGYIGVLIEPESAFVQFGDMALTVVRDSAPSVLKSLPKSMREQVLTSNNMGINQLSQEFAGGEGKNLFSRGVQQLLRQGFRAVGFKGVDIGNLNVNLVSAREEAKKHIRRPNTQAARDWHRTWQPILGQEQFDSLVRDIQNGVDSDAVRRYAYMAASFTRPLDPLDMPEFYNRHPNLRMYLQLKSFATKQFDLLRKRGYSEIYQGVKQGDHKRARRGVYQLTRAMMLMSLGGATIDWLRNWLTGDETDFPDSLLNGLLYTHLGTTYLLGLAVEDGPGTAITEFFVPPITGMVDEFWNAIANQDMDGMWQYLPMGRTLENLGASEGRDALLQKAGQAWADGDARAAHTYMNAYNRRPAARQDDKRITPSSVRQSAQQQKKGDE